MQALCEMRRESRVRARGDLGVERHHVDLVFLTDDQARAQDLAVRSHRFGHLRRMHEYAKIDQELGRVSEEFQYQRWALFRDLAKPQAIGEEITR